MDEKRTVERGREECGWAERIGEGSK